MERRWSMLRWVLACTLGLCVIPGCVGGDADNDGIPDGVDNCRTEANFDQDDVDNDGIGDVCDNCPDNSNTSQADDDGDGIGDVCDEIDNDGPL